MSQKHMVVCRECGRQFDASKGGYYDKQSRRYTCPKCGKQIKKDFKEYQADQREQKTGMRQSTGAMIAKIAVGAIFLIVAITSGDLEAGAKITGIVLAAALIAWALIPYFKAKKARDAAAAQATAEREAAEYARLNTPWTCPACGAKTKGDACEYCGEAKP